MDKKPLIIKCLALGITLLFIGIAVAPGIIFTIVKASTDNNLNEVTSQVCDTTGYRKTTVKLTPQQYQSLEQYLVNFRARLNTTTSPKEAVLLFREAVVEVSRYGLLPNQMNITQTQRLVTGEDCYIRTMHSQNRKSWRFQGFNHSNVLCLIAGQTKETCFHSHFEIGCSGLTYILFVLYIFAHLVSDDPAAFMTLINFVQGIRDLYHTTHLLGIIDSGLISLGTCTSTGGTIPPFIHYEPATGWITTLSFLGKKSWDGSFFGHILPLLSFDASETIYYTGVLGFQGIKLTTGSEQLFYLGFAAYVNID